MTSVRMKDDESSNIIEIDLSNQQSIKHFTDTVWMDGLYGKLKLESPNAIKEINETARMFDGLQNTFITFNSDSTYKLDNQPMLFGIVTDSFYRKKIVGNWNYLKKTNELSLKVASDEFRHYSIIKIEKNLLVIDEDWRILNEPPVKEITLIRQ